MKNLKTIFTALLCTVLFVACEKGERYYLPDSQWELTGAVTDPPLKLIFSQDQLLVQNAWNDYPPFDDGLYDYYINEDDELRLFWEEYDSYDGTTSTSSMTLDYFMTGDSVLTIVYDPWVGRIRKYRFVRIL